MELISRAMAMAAAVVAVVMLAAVAVPPASGQAVTAAGACTKSLLTSFTPCLAFISNGTNGSGAGSWSPPSADCCTGLAAVVNLSTSCAELILAGRAAVGIQVNCTLAVALPKECNSTASFSLECTNAPTTVAVSPSGPAAAPSLSPATASNAPAPSRPPASHGAARSSAWRRGGGGRVSTVLPALAVVLGVGAMIA